METLAKQNQYRVASINEIFSISYNFLELNGASNLTPRARRYLFFFVALVKIGYTAVAVPMEALAEAIYRAQGQTKSVRTLRTALQELEKTGYLRRNKYRIGDDHFRSVIILNTDKFVYWTQRRSKNVIPLPTQSHNSGYRQVLPKANLTTTKSRVNSQNTYKSENNKPRAHARCNLNTKNHKYHPLIYTLMVVLKGEPEVLRRKVLSLATHEIRIPDENVSGVNWRYWESRWPFLDHRPDGERELIAKSQILPALKKSLCPRSPEIQTKTHGSSFETGQFRDLLQSGERGRFNHDDSSKIRELVSGFLKNKQIQMSSSSSGGENTPPLEGEIVLEETELALLTFARNRTKQISKHDRQRVVFPNPSRLYVTSEDTD